MAWLTSTSLRAVLALIWAYVFSGYTILFVTYTVKLRRPFLSAMAALASGLCATAMWFPNKDYDWIVVTRRLTQISLILCWYMMQHLVAKWTEQLQRYTKHKILMVPMFVRYRKSSFIWMLITLGCALVYRGRIFISMLICVLFLTLGPWLDGIYQAYTKDLKLPFSTNMDDLIFGKSHVSPDDMDIFFEPSFHTSKALLFSTAHCLVVMNALFCIATASLFTFSVIGYQYPKLYDLDLEYIAFSVTYASALIPFFIMLSVPSGTKRLTA